MTPEKILKPKNHVRSNEDNTKISYDNFNSSFRYSQTDNCSQVIQQNLLSTDDRLQTKIYRLNYDRRRSQVKRLLGKNCMCLMLYHFFSLIVNEQMGEMNIFYNPYGNQNENFSITIILHYLVNTTKRLDEVTVTFPTWKVTRIIWIKYGANYETLDDWNLKIRTSRVNTSPFEVIKVQPFKFNQFKNWNFLNRIPQKFLFRGTTDSGNML